MEILTDSLVLDEDRAAALFAALGAPARLKVLRALVRAGPEGLSMGTLGARTGVTGSTLTHHLRSLAAAGFVRQERRGRHIVCSVDYRSVEALSAWLLKECCADRSAQEGNRDD